MIDEEAIKKLVGDFVFTFTFHEKLRLRPRIHFPTSIIPMVKITHDDLIDIQTIGEIETIGLDFIGIYVDIKINEVKKNMINAIFIDKKLF